MSGYADLHIHTTASDGTDSIEELLEKVTARGLRFFSVTDHDTIDGSLEIARRIPRGIGFVQGIEFSCVSPGGKCHILGYDYDPADPVFAAALEEGCRLRQEKLARRLAFLKERFDIVLTDRERSWLYSRKSPGKPHLGQILVDRGLAADLDTAIEQYINPCRGGRDRITAETAIRAIAHAGGIPVWAHPLGGEGEDRLTVDEFEGLLRELTAWGVRGLECYYSRYTREDVDFLLDRARDNGLLVSGGSDYHGTNKTNIALGKLNAESIPVDADELTILRAFKPEEYVSK